MTWIILSILVLILAPIIGLILGASITDGKAAGSLIGAAVISVISAFLWGLITLAVMWSPVGAGHVGLVKSISGTYVEQLGEGTHWVAPWKSVEVVSVQNQEFRANTKCYDATWNECLDVFTKDNNDAFVIGSLNWHVDSDNILTLYKSYPNFEKTIIETRFSQAVKDEMVKYVAADIAPSRELIRVNVRETLKADLAKYSISADDFLMPNIEFRKELKDSFERKAQASVDAQTEANKVEIATNQARQKVETAKGEANVLRETAQGQADANALISQSITPNIIQYELVKKIGDKITVALVPSNGSILDISKLIPQTGQ